jgi:RNA polymerase sigma factor (TIGR02999 family)
VAQSNSRRLGNLEWGTRRVRPRDSLFLGSLKGALGQFLSESRFMERGLEAPDQSSLVSFEAAESSFRFGRLEGSEKAMSALVSVVPTAPPGCACISDHSLTSQAGCTIVATKLPVVSQAGVARVPDAPSQSVSELLVKWQAGDQEALQVLIPLVYRELRRIAQYHLRQERPDHTLQSTALVHEAYLRLMKQGPAEIENRAHFLAVASRLMRQILVDHARGHRAAKRGGGYRLELTESSSSHPAMNLDLVALDDALNELARLDAQQARIVELKFFGGLSIEDTAQVIGVSRTTIKREWATARAWLRREMAKPAKP